MWKYILAVSILFSGCSYFEFNVAMCDKIAKEQGDMPEECRNYNEAEAEKAFNKTKPKTASDVEDAVEFKK